MPALQVRDFPATLYDELKEYAARNHRSIAQQTIIAVEEMLAEASALRQESFPFDADRLSRPAPRNGDIQLASAGVAKGSFLAGKRGNRGVPSAEASADFRQFR